MTLEDLNGIARGMAPVVADMILRATAPLAAENAILRGDLAALRDEVEVLRQRAPLQGERGEPGSPGQDGAPGRDGADGVAGASVTLDDLAPLVTEQVAAAIKAVTPKDPVALAGALIDRDGNLVLTLSDGSTQALGGVVGKDGRDGVDGRDGIDGKDGAAGAMGEPGFGLEDFDASVSEDGGVLILSFERGDTRHTYELQIGMLYRGVFREGEAYVRGNWVTFGGSTWHCNAPTSERPGEGKAEWTLAVKKGRDGRDGAPGQKGEPGKKGDPGRDGRSVG